MSSTGEALYTIPLLAPPGRAGMAPELSLVYDSSAEEGTLGMGFRIAGLSAITRCPKTLARDGFIQEVRDQADDALCLDGKRLVLVHDGGTTREYRTFPDTFRRVMAYAPFGWEETQGPAWFRTYTREGLIVDYGAEPAGGLVLARNGTPREWWVTQTSDRHGNHIDVTYRNDKAPDGYTVEHAPLRIDYTAAPGHAASRAVVFDYSLKEASARRTLYSRGMALERSLKLDRIRMLGPGEKLVRAYAFTYELGPGTGRTRMTTATECAADGVCKPPTRFAWNGNAPAFGAESTALALPFSDKASVMTVDVTGDGLDDLVVSDAALFGQAPMTDWFVARNLGGSPGSAAFSPFTLALEQTPEGKSPDPFLPERGTAIDVNQDGRSDLLMHDVAGHWGHWHVLQAQATSPPSFVEKNTSVPRPFELKATPPGRLVGKRDAVHLADVDGNGVADLLQCSEDPDFYAQILHWALYRWNPSLSDFDPTPEPIPELDGYPCTTELHTVDLNADGKVDLVVPRAVRVIDGMPVFGTTYAALSWQREGIWAERDTQLPVAGAQGGVFFLDANGDGLPDAVSSGSPDGQLYTFFNTGDGFTAAKKSLPGLVLGATEYARLASPIDLDGDGRQDLLIPLRLGAATIPSWMVLRSTGSVEDGTFSIVETSIPFEAKLVGDSGVTLQSPYGPRVTDLDGDGDQDVILPVGGFFKLFRNFAADQDTLATITDGMSAHDPGEPGDAPNVVVLYDHLVDRAITEALPEGSKARDELTYDAHHDAANACAYPRRCVVGPRRVVSGYAINNGADKLRAFQVAYRDGRYDRRGIGFVGFGERIVRDLDTGAGTIEVYDNQTFDPGRWAYPFAGQVALTIRYNPGLPDQPNPGQIELGTTQTELEMVPTYDGTTYFTLPVARRERREQGWLPSGARPEVFARQSEQASTTFLGETLYFVDAYDRFGNVLAERTSTPDVGLEQRVTREVVNDETSWLLGQAHRVTECSRVGLEELCRVTAWERNALGEAEIERRGSGDGDPETEVTLRFERDDLGNITRTTAWNALGERRQACTSYDAEAILPFAQRNAAGHLRYLRFDAGSGALRSTRDPNGLVTRWAYDGLGRVTEELRPDGTRTTYERARVKGARGWVMQQHRVVDGGEDERIEFDRLGRAVRFWRAGVEPYGTPAPRIYQEIAFDARGEHLARRSVPTREDTSPAEMRYDAWDYDAAGRVVRHETPWHALTTTSYDGSTVEVLDPSAVGTRVENDALGRPVSVRDGMGGTTLYRYGPFGMLAGVTDPGGALTWMRRDAYGRVRARGDADRGTSTTHYDGFGQLRSSTDALGREVLFQYDLLGRRTARIDLAPDAFTRWEYDGAPHGLGKLSKVTSPEGYEERFGYDSFSRLASSELVLDNESFTTKLGYDALGRVSTIAYPEGVGEFRIRREYDPYGHLRAVRDDVSGMEYWRLTEADEAGRTAREVFGNGVVSTHRYAPDKGRVEQIAAALPGSWMPLQFLRYDYDDKLNLATRTDAVQGHSEHFEHDALDRLTCARLDEATDCTLAYDYAPDGNVHRKSDVGIYTYDPDHPHAVQQVGADKQTSYGYDAVGNQIARPFGETVEYTPFDLPRLITRGDGQAVRFDYDGEERRIRKTTAEAVTVSVEGLYERVTHPKTGEVEHRYAVFGRDRLAAIVTRAEASESTTRYVLTDNLGSVDLLLNEQGKVVERRSYDPFGARRSSSWGEPAPAGGFSSSVPVGFTGQDEDGEIGLVDMKGRIYDPKLGRFLTPDPVVGRPAFGQAWNPYTYALNSPLNYVDPSGLDGDTPEDSGGEVVTPPTLPDGSTTIWVFGVRPDRSRPPEGALAGPPPTDTGVTGNSSGFVPSEPPTAPENTKQDPFWDTVLGAVMGLTELADRQTTSALLNIPTVGMYSAYGFWSSIWAGYQEDGVVGALNAVNPLYAIGRAGADASLAGDRGDYRAAGAAGAQAVAMTTVAIAGVVAGGIGGVEGAAGEGLASGAARNLHAEAVAARDALAADLSKSRHPPATVVGAYSPSSGRVTAGASRGGGLGCAEGVCAEALQHPPDIQFTTAVRPRTGQSVDVCSNCEVKYGRGAFPDPSTRFWSDRESQ